MSSASIFKITEPENPSTARLVGQKPYQTFSILTNQNNKLDQIFSLYSFLSNQITQTQT